MTVMIAAPSATFSLDLRPPSVSTYASYGPSYAIVSEVMFC